MSVLNSFLEWSLLSLSSKAFTAPHTLPPPNTHTLHPFTWIFIFCTMVFITIRESRSLFDNRLFLHEHRNFDYWFTVTAWLLVLYLLIYCVCECVCYGVSVLVIDNLWDRPVLSCHVGLGNKIQVPRLGSKHLCHWAILLTHNLSLFAK